ncbi:MAG: lipoyl synthase [Gammaproteobacteria bacterium]|nr:lipoyl synthase [Gammaproteobacteria bacterium]NNC96891.1 lipoyl synthase [Gammaproteobacteria bacterium]NNM13997.1 lipoyl synthase [Gammaproteobacteria bacterium]
MTTSDQTTGARPKKLEAGKKMTAAEKMARIPVKIEPTIKPLRKPDWIRVKLPLSNKVDALKQKLRDNNLVTVCEEASCPNLTECFTKGTATFMIMGDICTRRCSFCDVAHGRPNALDAHEPENLSKTIQDMDLRYVVITSVDRDDLLDGGAQHFVDCIQAIRTRTPEVKIEVLVPDFRGRLDKALEISRKALPDVFNHNLETVPRIYRKVRPGSDYQHSLDLLAKFKAQNPEITTKSGIMVGIDETYDEVIEVMQDLRNHNVDMLTVGQYLQPSRHHLPVTRYWTPQEFKRLEETGYELGFTHVASGPLVRSSYHADLQAENKFGDRAS